MRYILFILSILISQIAISQTVTQPGLRDYQVSGAALPDSVLYILGTDTLDGSAKQGLGKFHRADTLFARFGDHDFYGLGTGRSPVFGEDSIETALDSMYVLFKGLDAGLVTKIEMLQNGILQFDKTDAVSGATKEYMTVRPLQQDEGNVDYVYSIFTADHYGDRFNDIHSQGWNLLGGNVKESGKQGFGHVTEGFFQEDATTLRFEDHTIFYTDAGYPYRNESLVITDDDFSEWYKYFTVNDVFGLDPRNNYKFFQFACTSDTGVVEMFLWSPKSANTKAAVFQWNETTNRLSLYPQGTSNSTIDCSPFPFSRHALIQRTTVASAYGLTMATIAGNTSDGYFGNISPGYGLDLTSDVLLIDTSQVATQYDLTTITGGDDWGTDVVNTDLTLTGDGTVGNVLKVDTSEIATQFDLVGLGTTNLSIAQSGATQVIQSSTGTDVGVRNLYGLLITEGATDTLHFRVDSSLFATTYDLTQIPISSLRDAAATNSISNANYKQEWAWNTLAGGDGLKLSSTSTAAASDLQKLFNVSLSGTNGTSGQDTYAGYFSNTHAGTTSTNYGVYGISTNGTTANYGVYGVANGSNGNGVVGSSSANIGVLGIGAIGVYASATSAVGVDANATSGIAIQGTATTGTGLEVLVTSGIPLSVLDNSAGTNTVEPMMQMYHLTSGTAAAGIGSSIVYNNEANDGSDYVSNTLTSKWSTATALSRVSDFIISGVNAAVTADLLTVKGSGQIQLNKYTGGAFSGTAAYNVLIDASGNLIVGSVPVGSNNVTEENNAVVQSGTLTYDFQNPFDVTADGGTEVNISFDGGEFTTVTAIESDDYMLMHDSGTPANQKILWTDVLIDLIAFEDGNSSVGTGNTIDVGEGLDIDMSPSTEANINLDASEFQIDGTAEGTEYVLIHDADTTAGHQIQRRLVSSFSGGTDTNFGEDDLTWTGNRAHNSSTYTTTITGSNNDWRIEDTGSGPFFTIEGNIGDADAAFATLTFEYSDSDYATNQKAWSLAGVRETDDIEHSTLEIRAEEATSAPPVATWEENENLSDNTQETSLRLNSGIAYTQYWESTGANAITLDRGYYNVALLSGHTGTITLPQIYGVDEANVEIDAAQVAIGQEYVITNLSGSSVTIAAFNPSLSSNDDWLNGTEAGTYTLTTGSSVILKAVTIVSNEGHWFIYD